MTPIFLKNSGGPAASSVQVMNHGNKGSFGLNAMGGSNVETYKSLGDVFGIQAAVDSMKTAAYGNQEIVPGPSVTNVNGTNSNHNISPQSRNANNMTDNEKKSNGGKLEFLDIAVVSYHCFYKIVYSAEQ